MGLDINAVRFLISARKQEVSFSQVLTIGRQDLNVFPNVIKRILEKEGLLSDAFDDDHDEHLYGEKFFECLGAQEVSALDVSDFEGAAIVHDLNRPISKDHYEKYDVVYDGGTLEHVFNFPVALKNCMEMVRQGGRLIIHTVANNYCGHGFYQFSPELFFRSLSEVNGYELERMIIHPMGPYGSWRLISDPERIKSRVELMTIMPVQLLIQAARTKSIRVFDSYPQQSDYTPRWAIQEPRSTQQCEPNKVYAPTRSGLARLLPRTARFLNAIKTGFTLFRSHTIWNRKSFQRVPKK